MQWRILCRINVVYSRSSYFPNNVQLVYLLLYQISLFLPASLIYRSRNFGLFYHVAVPHLHALSIVLQQRSLVTGQFLIPRLPLSSRCVGLTNKLQGCLRVTKAGGKVRSEGTSMFMYVPPQGVEFRPQTLFQKNDALYWSSSSTMPSRRSGGLPPKNFLNCLKGRKMPLQKIGEMERVQYEV